MSWIPDRAVQENGILYGYPQCCIDDFKGRDNASTITPEQGKVHLGTGFIPCHKHALMILAGKITLDSLIKKRRCKTQFPIGIYDNNDPIALKHHHDNVQRFTAAQRLG